MTIDGITVHPSITAERVLDAADRYEDCLDNPGFCLACGEEAEGVEPDARRYRCEACGQKAVYGVEALIIHFGGSSR